MTHLDVYEWFKRYFPQYAEHVETWFQNGKSSVRVRQENKQEFIFTYNGEKNWCFETVDSYVMRMKERKAK